MCIRDSLNIPQGINAAVHMDDITVLKAAHHMHDSICLLYTSFVPIGSLLMLPSFSTPVPRALRTPLVRAIESLCPISPIARTYPITPSPFRSIVSMLASITVSYTHLNLDLYILRFLRWYSSCHWFPEGGAKPVPCGILSNIQ